MIRHTMKAARQAKQVASNNASNDNGDTNEKEIEEVKQDDANKSDSQLLITTSKNEP